MPLLEINIYNCHDRCGHKNKLYLFINNLLIDDFMDLQLFVDRGPISGHLVVKDQNGKSLIITGASYTSSDSNILTVSGSDSGFALAPVNLGTATFSYTANGISGNGTISVVASTPGTPTTIDFVVDVPQAG
jgi:hypothetical protein